MARRTSLLDDILDIVTHFGWPLGVALAIVSFAVFQSVLTFTKPPAPGPEMVQSVPLLVARAASTHLRWIAPGIFLLAALVAAVRRGKSRSLLAAAGGVDGAAAIQQMSWAEFEMLVAESFRAQGFEVWETGRAGPDGGVDTVIRRGGQTFLVQCKHWRASRVGVEKARELFGLMAAHKASGGYLVTSGSFTPDAEAFARGKHLVLLDGEGLQRLLRGRSSAGAPRIEPQPPHTTIAAPPDCPTCGRPMVKREARRGPNAGAPFWGCSAYPSCRDTRDIASRTT